MKHLLSTAICFLALSNVLSGQTPETFDIATFQSPKGWNKQASQNSIQFSTEDKAKGTYCLITLFRSVPSLGNSREDFTAAWQTIVKEAVNVAVAPQMFPSNNPEDWALEGGFAPFEKGGEKGVVLLYTISGHGKMVNVMILTNTQAYESNITAFMESISPKKPESGRRVNPETEKRQQQTPDSPNGSQPFLIQYSWKQTQNRRDIGGYAGYSSNTYQFYGNNTYKFSRVDFQNYSPKYYLEIEEGTYKITGNTIMITPRKAMFSSHKIKKEDPPLKSGNLGLATLQYSFEIINLNNNWTLLLSPVDGNETKRDGTFSFWLNGAKTRSYAYASVNANGELIRQ